jgi:hypothetical protein
MRRPSILLAFALLAAAPAAAQPTIQPGESVEEKLSASDPRLENGSHYDVWRFDAQPGHVYLVTLRSSRFDAFLSVGFGAGAECSGCQMNDDGGGGTDAALRFTPPAAARYEIRASAYGSREATGEYELTLRDEGVAPADAPTPAPTPIQAGETVRGRLEAGDETYPGGGGAYTDTYLYQGRAGETLVVTLRSAEFDAVVAMGRSTHAGCRPMDSDDDGAGGTDSRLEITLSQDGPYHIHVRTARVDGLGAYTLHVERK